MEVQKKAYEVRNGETLLLSDGKTFHVEHRRNSPAFCHFTNEEGITLKVRVFQPVTVRAGGAQ